MTSLFSPQRKGQAHSAVGAGGAAVLVLLITLIIIFYILFLPPEERAALLNDGGIPGTPNSDSSGYAHLIGTTPLATQIGSINYISESEIEHPLNSFTIYTKTDANLIHQVPSLYVKNSAFDKQSEEITFSIDKYASERLYLSFNVFRTDGILQIYLNGLQLFEGTLQEGSSTPISLPQDYLKQNNILYFTVSSPGFAFWRVNEYELQNLRIVGDVTDSSHSMNMQKFFMVTDEYDSMEKGVLQFFPDCDTIQVGKITLDVNGETVFNGIPDCGLKNYITLSKETLRSGENTVEFVSEYGSYIIDQLELNVKLIEPDYPIYYFDLDEDLFVSVDKNNEFCGNIDGVCPNGCDSYEDKDCCFAESRNNYWCDFKPDNPRDRCVNMVLASYTDRCVSGYENYRGQPPEAGEQLCGDDTDGYCPSNCPADYDKDCCFEIENAYWCEDVPYTGVDDICTTAVTLAECDACSDGYVDKDNRRPNCPTIELDNPSILELKAGVHVFLEVFFVDDSYKKVNFNLNGEGVVPMNTYKARVKQIIDPYVREGTNSIVIQPQKDVTISHIKVTVE
ncbi:hypothetical protein K9M74_05715 [Candidatus Woesearchaeota archaeon]|nr:hypothetical protein [Candidatus Woesearchaeota archaeon]